MRTHIRWLFWKVEDIRYIIKNDLNNENWPNADTYGKMMTNWNKVIENQQKYINQFEIKNNKTRQLIADVWTWFINEHNLLKKPARRALLEKEKECLRLMQELKVFQHNLEHPKEELEEYEKQCLLNKIKIAERKLKIVREERMDLEEDFFKEKRELCQRLTYTLEDLKPFADRNPEERIDSITRRLVISSKIYHEFWRKFANIDPDSEALNDLNNRLTAWYNHNGGEYIEYNPHEIWVEEKTDDSLVFLWKPVEQVVGKDESGKEIKGIYLPLLKNYLFNYYGEWYEVSDYYQVGYNSVVVETQRSIFYNDYWALLKCSGNIILHHSPLSAQEICSCPNSENYTSRNTFILDYKLEFDFYRMGNDQKKEATGSHDPKLPFIYTGIPEKTTPDEALANPGSFWQHSFEKGVIFLLLSKRFKGVFANSKTHFAIPITEEVKDYVKNFKPPPPILDFKRIKSYNESKMETELDDERTLIKFLDEQLLTSDNMFHFFKDHVKATLLWRNRPFWKGPYWILHNEARLTETIGNDGNCVTLRASGMILGQVKELVTCIPEGDDSAWKWMKTAITVSTTIVAVATLPLTAGASAAVKAGATVTRAGAGIVGGLAQTAINRLTEEIPYGEFSQSMTIHEFFHKFAFSGINPISLRLEFSTELKNQYLNKRELKGQMLYTYANCKDFGLILNQDSHYLKASIISWNMTRNSNWFREKIENGVFVYKGNYLSFYDIKLSESTIPHNEGGNQDSDWNTFIVKIKQGKKKIPLGSFDPSKALDSFRTYFRVPNDSLYREMAIGKFSSHHNGPGGTNETGNTRFSNGKNEVCWGCGLDKSKPHRLQITKGGDLYTYFDSNAIGETHIKVPDNCMLVIDAPAGSIYIEEDYKPEIIKNPNPKPAGFPPSTALPVDPSLINAPPATPFNPNQFPNSGNLIPTPGGSGEFEPSVPDIDISLDPDFGQDLDLGVDVDTDTDKDDDKPKDPEMPTDLDDDYDND